MRNSMKALALALACTLGAQAQTEFKTPDQAVKGLIAAVNQKGEGALMKLFGPGADKLLDPDPLARRESRRLLQLLLKENWRLANLEGDRKLLRLGLEGWPFPVTVAKGAAGWHFDAAAGEEEILNRRVGRNELINIETLGQVAQAEKAFAAQSPNHDYTSLMASHPGQHDGLFWPVAAKQPLSPLQAALKNAAKYAVHRVEGSPWFGYRYHFLSAQGANAPGGAKEYSADGKQTAGWAVVAYPSTYGKTGVMTFMVNQDGKIYERDLGADTAKQAEALSTFDPDDKWSIVNPEQAR